MKKIFLSILASVICVFLNAQESAPLAMMYDGINLCNNNYYGTARTMAMGNAVTAVGGDLGTIPVNPAGGAVAKYSQAFISPYLSISSISSKYSPVGEQQYGAAGVNNMTRFSIPSFGVSFSVNTGRDYGIRSWNFVLMASQTNHYNSTFVSGGVNSKTSLLSEFGAAAQGKTYDELSSYGTNASWDLVAGYNGRLFGEVGLATYEGNSAIGILNGFAIPAGLRQTSVVTTNGYKRDFAINFSFDLSGVLFFGVNLGVIRAFRNAQETYYESPDKDYTDFPICLPDKYGDYMDTYYTGSSYNFWQYLSQTGIYAKFGAIYLPMPGLRLGAAIKTPSSLSTTEQYQYSAYSRYENSSCDGSSSSPVDSWSYRMRSPWGFNLGVAYTISNKALLSVDYELEDYASMQFFQIGSQSDYFYKLNQTVRNFCGAAHSVRLGLEVKPVPAVALRAGYTLATSPERNREATMGYASVITASDYYSDIQYYSGALGKKIRTGNNTMSFSFGAGYSSSGSFFADLAVRMNKCADTVYMPFYDYAHLDINGNSHIPGTSTEEMSPRIYNQKRLWDVMLTLGFRF